MKSDSPQNVMNRILLDLIRAVTLVTLLSATPAFADEGSPQAEGRALMEQGFAANKAGDKAKAQELYRRSFETYPSFDVAGNLGILELSMGSYLEAATHLHYCLTNFPSGESRDLKKLVEENFKEARKYVGLVTFKVNRPGATVIVDEVKVGTSPFEHQVVIRAGHHEAIAERDGKTIEETFSVERGKTAEVTLSFPEEVPAVASGLEGEEKDPWLAAEPRPEGSERRRPSLVPAYIMGGVSVAALGTSVAFKVIQGSQKSTIDDLEQEDSSSCLDRSNSDCAALRDAIDKHKTYAQVGDATLIAGGVGAALTIGYVIYALTKRRQPVQAGLAADKTGAFLNLSGSF